MREKDWKTNLVLFLTGQTVSLFGSSLVQHAITWYITLEAQSGIMMTIATICGFVPTFCILPFAGVWADRFNRKKLIVISDGAIALVTLTMAILFIVGYRPYWLIFVASALRAFGAGIQTPAVNAFLPQLVPQDKLTRVNAVNGTIQAVVTLGSPLLGGVLLAIADIQYVFLIDVFTAILAIVITLLFVKSKAHTKSLHRHETGYFTDLKEGLSYIRRHPFLKLFFLFVALFFILAAPSAYLTPLQVTRDYAFVGIESESVLRLTALEVLFSIGMAIGGIGIAIWGGFKNKTKTMATSGLIVGIGTLGFATISIVQNATGITSIFWMYLVICVLVGMTMPAFNTPSTVMLQENVDEDHLGRVFGVFNMLSTSMLSIGMIVFGPIADIVPIRYILLTTGTLLLIETAALAFNKKMRAAGMPVLTAESPAEIPPTEE